jgi:hypothetical protein
LNRLIVSYFFFRKHLNKDQIDMKRLRVNIGLRKRPFWNKAFICLRQNTLSAEADCEALQSKETDRMVGFNMPSYSKFSKSPADASERIS